jgi:hypothetical protein
MCRADGRHFDTLPVHQLVTANARRERKLQHVVR